MRKDRSSADSLAHRPLSSSTGKAGMRKEGKRERKEDQVEEELRTESIFMPGAPSCEWCRRDWR